MPDDEAAFEFGALTSKNVSKEKMVTRIEKVLVLPRPFTAIWPPKSLISLQPKAVPPK